MSAIYEDTSLEANLRIVISRLIFYEDRKQGQVIICFSCSIIEY